MEPGIKRGVSLYSFQEELFLGRITVADCIAFAASIGANGIEILPEQNIATFPHVSDAEIGALHDVLASHGCHFTCYDMFLDTKLRKGEDTPVSGPSQLLEAVNAAGRKGVAFQRYKGLGEMNKDQLWETTLDREARSLLQVKIREVDEADDIFVKLMGDVVEPRREFIQDNALSVVNLDA